MRQLTLVLFALVLVQSLCCGCTGSPTAPTEEAGRPMLVTPQTPGAAFLPTGTALAPINTPRPPTNTPAPPPPANRPAQPAAGAVRVRERDSAEMVFVPAGEFIMGSADSDSMAYDAEKPQHTVYLDAFWIDKTEVTNGQYRRCVAAGKCRASGYADDARFNGDAQPVVGVSWYDAAAYAQWVGGRLPTEAEWEKAARGTDRRLWPWGNVWDASKVNSVEQGPQATTAVGSYPAGASPYGAMDMAGNVWEWVADWYDSGYYARSPGRNPPGPHSGEYKVLRGGSWNANQMGARLSSRFIHHPGVFFFTIGFRVVCAPSSWGSLI